MVFGLSSKGQKKRGTLHMWNATFPFQTFQVKGTCSIQISHSFIGWTIWLSNWNKGSWILYTSKFVRSSPLAGVNQQPPVHQLRMRPFKLFWGWTQTHLSKAFLFSSSFAQGFFLPQSFPLLPTYLLPS